MIPTTAWLLRVASCSPAKADESVPAREVRPTRGHTRQSTRAGDISLRGLFSTAAEMSGPEERNCGDPKDASSSLLVPQLNSPPGSTESPSSSDRAPRLSRLAELYGSLCLLLRETSPLFLAAVCQRAAEEEQGSRVDVFYPVGREDSRGAVPGGAPRMEDEHGRFFWRHVTERLGEAVYR